MMSPARSSLEYAFAKFRHELQPSAGQHLRVFVLGKTQALNPIVHDQLLSIGHEAVTNALRHSGATNIEVEVQYLSGFVCVVIRDNGCGIDPEKLQPSGASHHGLRRMREGAEEIGGRFNIWSRPGSGTEVSVTVHQ